MGARGVGRAIAIGAGIGAAGVLWFRLSPRPGARVIRTLFERDSRRVKRALLAHAPGGTTAILDEPYRHGDPDAQLDVHLPGSVRDGERLPAVVWTHGGAWLSGGRADVAPYFELLASHGFAVVSVGYSLAPGRRYPTPVAQVNDALAHLAANADRLHVDPDRVVMAGDSAGAQITSQVAAATTDPGFVAELGLRPALRPDQLRGVVLFCGFFDMATFVERGRHAPIPFLRWGIGTMVWAYTGSRAPDSPALREMSTIDHATAAFPAAFVSGGNADPLTDVHSRPFAARLEALGVDVDVETLFYEPDHQPALGHEYQFDLDGRDGMAAFERMLAFVRERTA